MVKTNLVGNSLFELLNEAKLGDSIAIMTFINGELELLVDDTVDILISALSYRFLKSYVVKTIRLEDDYYGVIIDLEKVGNV